MSAIAEDIESFVNETGKVPRSAVYGRFELVTKRVIDQALERLAQSHRLVVGATDVAPVRQARRAEPAAVSAPPPPPPPKVEAPVSFEDEMRARVLEAKIALGGPTLRQAILAQFEPGRVMTADLIIAKLGKVWSEKSIRTEMSVMKSKRLLANRQCHGWWLPGTVVEGTHAPG